MLKLLILLISLIICKSFINFNKNKFYKTCLYANKNYNPIMFNNYDCLKSTYTILSKYDIKTQQLLYDLKKHKVNHIYIDITLFALINLDSICDYHLIDKSKKYDDPLIFNENYKYIGGLFEIYKIMLKHE